jgi:hypothetical protein
LLPRKKYPFTINEVEVKGEVEGEEGKEVGNLIYF